MRRIEAGEGEEPIPVQGAYAAPPGPRSPFTYQAIGDRLAFQPPLAKEGLALLLDLGGRSRVDHVTIILGEFVMHMAGRVADQVAVLVNGAALDGQVVAPERHQCRLEARCSIDDHEFGPLQPAGIGIGEELALGGGATLHDTGLAKGDRMDSTGRLRPRKRPMPNRAIAALSEILRPEIDLSKSRLETLCLMVLGMVSARSVNLSHIACERPGTVQTASTYRRLQRFFQHVRPDEDWALALLNRPRRLSATSRQRAWAWSRSVSAKTVFTTALTIALEARLRRDRLVGLAHPPQQVALEVHPAALPAGAEHLAR